MRGLLRALAEEEERRAAVEGSLELTAKEAECAWRVELLTLYRETAARVQRLSAAQAARYQALEESLESSAAEQGPEAVAQLELLTNLAVETRSQVQREVDGVGTALAAMAARQGEGQGIVAELEGQVEGFVAGWGAKMQALGATVDEATAGLESRSNRAHDLNLKQQQAQQGELDEAVAQIAAVQRATAAELRRGEAHMTTAVHAVHAAHTMAAQRGHGHATAGGGAADGAAGGGADGATPLGLEASLETLRRLLERAPAATNGDGAAGQPPPWHERRGAAAASAKGDAEAEAAAAAKAEAEVAAYAAKVAVEAESYGAVSSLLL